MTRLIDLSRPLRHEDKAKLPQALAPLSRIIAPDVDFIDHKRGAAIMQAIFACPDTDLPQGQGWAEEDVSLSSHLGTHVDAPWHYGSTCQGKPAKTVDQIPLEELFLPACVLDLSHLKGTGQAITIDHLQAALKAVSYSIQKGDAVLIRTDHDKFAFDNPIKYNYPGLTRESALWLAEQGAKVGGTDALGWDRPFHIMVADYRRTNDKRYIWDAHFAYRDIECYVVQQLVNLDLLPPYGFKVGFFPLLLVGASSAPARVVAFLD